MTDDSNPRGQLTVRISAMPADTNANGDIFGGWVLSRMDQAGGIGRGLPLSSMATNVKLASVTFSWISVWKRRAQASTWMTIEVRPMLSTAV
jgi:hypothetical protein